MGMTAIHPITTVQKKYYRDNHRFIVIAAGRRSRKTLIAKQKIYDRARNNLDTIWFHAAPTRDQAKAIFWEDLKKYTKRLQKKEPSESNLVVTLRNNSEIHVIGMDKPQRIEGRTKSWNGCHLCEFGDFKPDAWETNVRPVLADTRGSAIIDGVPDPLKTNFANHKKLAQYASGGSIPIAEAGQGVYGYNCDDPEWSFYTWFSADVLDPKELKSIKDTTDPMTYRIEYEASFEGLGGKVFYAFKPEHYPYGNLDRSIRYDPNIPITLAFDFNVNPMTALLGHVKTNAEGFQEWLLFKGYFLKSSNTEQLVRRILDEHSATFTFNLTPCQSSIARQTSQEITADGYKTDLIIIKRVMKEYGKNLQVFKRNKNPPIHKRVSALNMMLAHRRLRFNPNDIGLKEFQKDLEFLSYKEGTSAIDESDKMRNHISAGGGYLCDKHWRVGPEIDTTGWEHVTT